MEPGEKAEALKLALTNEKKEKEFYLENASRTNDPVGRAMFESIAEDEAEHYSRLLELYEKMDERGKWPDEFSTDISSRKVGEMIDRLIGEGAPQPRSDDDDVRALKIALEFEEKGEKFYRDLAENAESEAERHFFSLLASIEREHRLSLDETLEYFEDPDGWMRRKGRGGLDGA